jgi:hypothetical protein
MVKSKAKIASNDGTPSEVLRKLANSDDELARLVAGNSNCDSELLADIYDQLISNDFGIEAACIILKNGRADASLMGRVLADFPGINEGRDVDYPAESSFGVLLAQHPNTPVQVIEMLCKSPFYFIRERIALRKELPELILQRLISDEHRSVRQMLASNPHIELSGLQILATDLDPTIRYKVALHNKSSESLLRMLVSDAVAIVAMAAQSKLPVS